MKLFHGTNTPFSEIDLNKSRTNKDFGKGFYLSDSYSQAEEMGSFKAGFLGGEVIVYEYEVDDDILKDTSLNIKVFTSYSEEWADFVLKNRGNSSNEQVHDYDLIYGPIADDNVGVQLRKYHKEEITFEEFLKKLKFPKGITFQYFFATEKAISKLKRL